jgi:creatinine amidohydrolase
MGSNPALATIEHGKQFYDLAVKEITSDYLAFIQSAKTA